MYLVEVALQNVCGFAESVRMRLENRLNVLELSTEQRRALVDAWYFTLFPDPSRATATAHLVGAGEAKGVLTIYGRDKRIYRLARDLGSGATKLYAYQQDRKKYRLLTEVTQEAAQYVRVQQRLPDEVSYERLFLVEPDSLPSLGSHAKTRSGTPVVGASGAAWGEAASFGATPALGQANPFAGPPAGMPPGAPPSGAPNPFAGPSQFGGGPSQFGGGPSQFGGGPSQFGAAPVNMMNALVRSEIEGGGPSPVDPVEDMKAELRRLKKSLQVVEQASQAQTELDELTRRKGELSGLTEKLAAAVTAREKAEFEVEQFEDISQIPGVLREKLATFEDTEARHRDEVLKANEDMALVEEQLDGGTPRGFGQDPYFWGGSAVTVGSLGAAVGFGLPWLALINLVGASVAAASVIRWITEQEQHVKLKARSRSVVERKARIQKQYELDTAVVKRMLREMEVVDPSELIARLDEAERKREALSEAQQVEQDLKSDPAVMDAYQELDRVEVRLRELEAAVMGTAGTDESPEVMRRRIVQLEKQLVSASAPTAPGSTADLATRSPARGNSIPQPRRTSSLQTPPPSDISAPDDGDDDDGYGSGYGGSGGGFTPGGHHLSGLWAAGTGGLPPAGGFGGAGGYGGGGGTGSLGLPPDRSRELIQAGTDLTQQPIESFLSALEPRFMAYLGALTDGVYARCAFGARGEVTVVDQQGIEVPYVALRGERLDLVDVALRLSVAEAVVSKVRIPLLIDDPFEGFPRKRRRLFVQMIEYLAQLTQVLVLSKADDLNGHRVELQARG
ncbi:MAG: hypothetical protein AAF627_10470 [Myxococcota bacterium]